MNSTFNRYLKITVGTLFVILGLCILDMDWIPGRFEPKFKTMMGVTMIGYGIYRIVHTYYQHDHLVDSDQEKEVEKE